MKAPTVILLVLLSLLITTAQSRGKNVTSNYSLTKHSALDSGGTPAIMTINSFEKGGDGGGPSECDGEYHSNNFLIVALSTRWYNKGERCFDYINIYYNGNSARAMVVDECDSNRGCRDNIVDASYAVWLALQVSQSDWGQTGITWSDA
ncbi:putative ripening-related protein 1 [Lactuca sativa]|uniref:putative ripening-related protein 1 n=1 Tax=Lactuca sativa TaxID=4236 RepID=UPI000CB5A48F|nr:putative ripening-related protein 1 [Lactuca sativa]